MEQVLKAYSRIRILLILGDEAMAQTDPLALLARHDQAFQKKAVQTLPVKTLRQTSLGYPPRPASRSVPWPTGWKPAIFEVVPEYTVGRLKGVASGNLLELREIVSLNGAAVKTPGAPFRLFTTETQIRYGETQAHPAKK